MGKIKIFLSELIIFDICDDVFTYMFCVKLQQ